MDIGCWRVNQSVARVERPLPLFFLWLGPYLILFTFRHSIHFYIPLSTFHFALGFFSCFFFPSYLFSLSSSKILLPCHILFFLFLLLALRCLIRVAPSLANLLHSQSLRSLVYSCYLDSQHFFSVCATVVRLYPFAIVIISLSAHRLARRWSVDYIAAVIVPQRHVASVLKLIPCS